MQIAPRNAEVARTSALRRAAQAALDAARVRRSVSLTIVITGDAALRKLNREFLGIDAPTDVLSFPFQIGRPGRSLRSIPEVERRGLRPARSNYLGDVIISLARARAQARIGGHALIDELRLLVIHGVLHLLGHDHGTTEEKQHMWILQAKALKQAGAWIKGPAQ